jgi:hypothetical protein
VEYNLHILLLMGWPMAGNSPAVVWVVFCGGNGAKERSHSAAVQKHTYHKGYVPTAATAVAQSTKADSPKK